MAFLFGGLLPPLMNKVEHSASSRKSFVVTEVSNDAKGTLQHGPKGVFV
jgi:hypothetical protein